MGSNELDIDDAQFVGNGNDQAVVIALDVEYDAPIFQHAGAAVLRLRALSWLLMDFLMGGAGLHLHRSRSERQRGVGLERQQGGAEFALDALQGFRGLGFEAQHDDRRGVGGAG